MDLQIWTAFRFVQKKIRRFVTNPNKPFPQQSPPTQIQILRSAVGMTHSLRSDLWWTIPFHVSRVHFGESLVNRLYSEIDHTYLSSEAQIITPGGLPHSFLENVSSVWVLLKKWNANKAYEGSITEFQGKNGNICDVLRILSCQTWLCKLSNNSLRFSLD